MTLDWDNRCLRLVLALSNHGAANTLDDAACEIENSGAMQLFGLIMVGRLV
jgi:hypothetical protein